MFNITKLKKKIRSFCRVISVIPTILLILGSFYIIVSDDLLSFIFSVIFPLLFILNLIFGIYWLFKKSKYSVLALIGLIIFFFKFDSFFQFNNENTDSDKESISIMTFNTENFGLVSGNIVNDRYKQVIDFINAQDVDVFVIQEFWNKGMKPFTKYPYYFLAYRQDIEKSTQIIFSKYPIINKQYIDFDGTNNNAMYADIAYNGEIIRIYNLHLESYRLDAIHQLNNPKSYSALVKRIGKAEKTRKEQAILVKNHIDNFNGKAIICGDFNATQFSTSYNLIKGSRKDSFIESGKGFGTTFELYKYPFRLDYILADDNFEITSHQNFEVKLSDHEPVIVKLTLN
ncbi:hypothetical protein DIS18_14595 [Algibacter marinivivus]|uniref:Endonuclease/exonuclease/phosphatase domain-containing protein n=1 Tax=Algibacter marinivivus TaxID=2100723 RepID=A0A2U2X146_9FLAO|nr:endonuclease/exonuclease/phosphatase family protein [Algibacter marinivivus]PWH81507.1 hypothetical protein DIS18_14595 [Algibacter marinivivus]